jgi:O-antigen ligase
MKTTSAQAISLLLAGSLCFLPFLVPYHQQPVLSFFPEWLAAALGVAAALALLFSRGVPAASFPAPACWLIAFALVLAAQATIGHHAYFQLPLLAALYVLYAALMIWLGANLAAVVGIERVAIVLAAFLLAGALANSLSGVVQYYGRPRFLEGFVAEARGHGAYGNIAQRNLYADYLALGAGALLFLWQRVRVRTVYAAVALLVIVWGSALSGSRGALLYSLWYVGLGVIAVRIRDCAETRRLRLAAYGLAAATVAAHLLVPWFNNILQLGTPGENALDRVRASLGEPARLEIARLALRVWISAPIAGVGVGGFARAAFELGLDPVLTQYSEIWTSPHNLPLHLLAETGALGALLVLGGLCVWGWQAAQRYREHPQPALWWLFAGIGVELIHSLTEFPLWSAHFLGVAALLIGVSSRIQPSSPAILRAGRLGSAALCLGLSIALAILLRDYIRLDSTRITGAAVTLAPFAQAERDAATLRQLRHGPLGPVAELWTLLGVPLNQSNLSDKVEISGRVARYWPANAVLARQTVFLAFDGKVDRAREVLGRALHSYPNQRESTLAILERARSADPVAIEPLIAMAKNAARKSET